MPPEILALIDRPHLLLAVLAAGAAIGIAVERFVEGLRRAERRAYWRGRKASDRTIKAVPLQPPAKDFDAAEQLRCVMSASFASRPLLNAGERRVIDHIDRALAEYAPDWRAMGQVALGEVLSSPDKTAFSAINSKRVDLLIVDAEYRPVHAVEFQGAGHYQGNAAARDAVKKEALRRAGIGYVEIVRGDTPGELRELIRKLAARKVAA